MGEPRLSPLFTWRGAIAGTSLPMSVKAVAFALSLHMNERGDSCFPAIETTAAESGASRATVKRALKTLEKRGWLTVTRVRGRANRYLARVPNEPTPVHPDPTPPVHPDPRGAHPEPRERQLGRQELERHEDDIGPNGPAATPPESFATEWRRRLSGEV